jgi:hypothetical protein
MQPRVILFLLSSLSLSLPPFIFFFCFFSFLLSLDSTSSGRSFAQSTYYLLAVAFFFFFFFLELVTLLVQVRTTRITMAQVKQVRFEHTTSVATPPWRGNVELGPTTEDTILSTNDAV